jgi:hypothetical protein
VKATPIRIRQSVDTSKAAADLERLSYGIGSSVASVVIKPETPEEKVARIVKEVPGVRR